jgi:hypothetical protein
MFPVDSMRSGASGGLPWIVSAMPLLEDFMALPFPTGDVRVWYGFTMGNVGGGGQLWMEDRGTYEARTGPTRLPFDAILVHELSHSYFGHEGLTQFLEVYLHNIVSVGSPALSSWPYVRGCQAMNAGNTALCALLDVYQLIGRDAMAKAFRQCHALLPRYGQPLPPTCSQAFVDEAPTSLKAEVAAKMMRVG